MKKIVLILFGILLSICFFECGLRLTGLCLRTLCGGFMRYRLLSSFGIPGRHVSQADEGSEIFFSRAGRNRWVVLTRDWKMISDGKQCRLYFLPDDPAQTKDIAGQRPEIVYELMQQLLAWRRTHIDKTGDNKISLTPEIKERLRKEGYW